MTTLSYSPTPAQVRAEFEELIKDIRPELHRYCARMVGSVIDGEDIVQDTLTKGYHALPTLTTTDNLRGWLFRIAHNKAIDHMRRGSQAEVELLDEYPLAAEPDLPLEQKELTAVALSVFLQLAPKHRSCVILKDVMGYSLLEISELLDISIPAIKAALHRGRSRLRELSKNVRTGTPLLDERERTLLTHYVDRFNARDFDTLRAMLANEVRLDLVGRVRLQGAAEVSNYFHRYEQQLDWHLGLGLVEGHPAILVYTPDNLSRPTYFILITWDNDQISTIRDYRYARYVMQDAKIAVL